MRFGGHISLDGVPRLRSKRKVILRPAKLCEQRVHRSSGFRLKQQRSQLDWSRGPLWLRQRRDEFAEAEDEAETSSTASAETMGVADVALYEDVLEQKQLIVDILKTLAGVTTKPDETNLDHRLGETCFRAHMHCGVQPIDYGAVEHHVRHALELLETR